MTRLRQHSLPSIGLPPVALTQRWRRVLADPHSMEHFLKQTMPVTESGCLIWTGSLSVSGYGLLFIDKRAVRAHRFAWILKNGAIPSGLNVCHKCDVRCCVNADHLFLGTHAENLADMTRKGRRVINIPPPYPCGDEHPNARLKTADVIAIREALSNGSTGRSLARAYGVSKVTIYSIKVRRTWSHI